MQMNVSNDVFWALTNPLGISTALADYQSASKILNNDKYGIESKWDNVLPSRLPKFMEDVKMSTNAKGAFVAAMIFKALVFILLGTTLACTFVPVLKPFLFMATITLGATYAVSVAIHAFVVKELHTAKDLA